jgi:hypothetical protein
MRVAQYPPQQRSENFEKSGPAPRTNPGAAQSTGMRVPLQPFTSLDSGVVIEVTRSVFRTEGFSLITHT